MHWCSSVTLVVARYWWHCVIVTHKLTMVMIKTFLFNTFYQCPMALLFTFLLMGAQVSQTALIALVFLCHFVATFHTVVHSVSLCLWQLSIGVGCSPLPGLMNQKYSISFKQAPMVHSLFSSFSDYYLQQVNVLTLASAFS